MSRIKAKSRGARAPIVGVVLALGLWLVGAQLVVAQSPQPQPDFTFTPQAPLPGETVTFTATGLKPNERVSWDFDYDGTFTVDATGTTAQHVYATGGQRTVVMRVRRGDEDRTDVVKTVNVNRPPTASFTASPNPATVGETVQFNAAASSDPDGTIASYAWDLDNDGQFDDASGAGAARSFATAGTYTVGLRVTDNRGSTGTATSTVTVNSATAPPPPPPPNQTPVASFTASPNPATVGQAVQLNATGSSDPDGTITSYAWDLDNDGQFDDASSATVSRSFAAPGSYPIRLRVTDDRGAADTTASVVTVSSATVSPPPPPPNQTPVASFTASPNPATVGQAVQLNAGASTDPDGTIASYAWDLDNDGQFDDASSATVSRSFAAPGNYSIRLRVTDDRGAADTTASVVTVDSAAVPGPPPNQTPVASFTASPNPATVGQAVQLNATGSTDPDGTIASYAWDLDNDGQFDDGFRGTAAASFAAGGYYTVRLRVTDAKGAADVESRSILVLPRPALDSRRLELMSPFPVVRLVARLTSKGAHVKMLAVRGAPRGAKVTVRCRGRGCRVRQATKVMASSGRLRFRSFERRLRAGVSLRILVTQPGKIGKYTSFKIRRSRAPVRRDRCVLSTDMRPAICPAS